MFLKNGKTKPFLQYGSDHQIFPISEASKKQVSLLGNLSAYLIY